MKMREVLADLFELCLEKKISLDVAKKRFVETTKEEPLSLEIIRIIRDSANDLLEVGAWQDAVLIQEILLAGLAPLAGNHEAYQLRGCAIPMWTWTVCKASQEAPDGHLFESTIELAESFAREAEQLGDAERASTMFHLLGALHLDPYIHGRTLTKQTGEKPLAAVVLSVKEEINIWRTQLEYKFGKEATHFGHKTLPPIEEALFKAVDYFQKAVVLRQQFPRLESLKALVQAYTWLTYLGITDDTAQIKLNGEEAINIAREIGETRLCSEVSNMLLFHDLPTTPKLTEAMNIFSMFNDPLDSLLKKYGLDRIFEQASKLFGLERISFPDRMLFWHRLKPLAQSLPEGARASYMRHGLELLSSAPTQQVREMFKQLRFENTQLKIDTIVAMAEGKSRSWSHDELLVELLLTCQESELADQELLAISALEIAISLKSPLVKQNKDILDFYMRTLISNAGVFCVHKKEYGEAFLHYMNAACQESIAGFPGRAYFMLKRAFEVTRECSEEDLVKVIEGLFLYVLKIESHGSDSITQLIQSIVSEVVCKITLMGSFSKDLLILLFELAKSRQFASCFSRAGQFSAISQDEGLNSIIDQLKKLSPELSTDDKLSTLLGSNWKSDNGFSDRLDAETILVAQIREAETSPGDSETKYLHSLQHLYDGALNKKIFVSSVSTKDIERETFVFPSRIRESLDSSTVLVSYFWAPVQNHTLGLCAVWLTQDKDLLTIGRSNVPNFEVKLGESSDGRTLVMHPYGLAVADIRKNILQNDPGLGAALEEDANLLFPPDALRFLDTCRAAGKNHLCIVPNGPLHYYPFHILGSEHQQLAEDWIVTYSPCLQAICHPQKVNSEHRHNPMSAFGVSEPNMYTSSLPSLRGADEEAAYIAKLFGVQALSNGNATRSHFMQALTTSERIHVAAHGRHNVVAPSFQSIYLSSDETSDGVVFAHDLLTMDLRGIDIMTLSACETALGRFDCGDNLRGIPAALLLAGVETLVGTFWNVANSVAQSFFVSFYKSLANGQGKLASYAMAQNEIRLKYPDYRDWGAFYYSGRW